MNYNPASELASDIMEGNPLRAPLSPKLVFVVVTDGATPSAVVIIMAAKADGTRAGFLCAGLT